MVFSRDARNVTERLEQYFFSDRNNQLARESYHQNKALRAATQKRYNQSEKGKQTQRSYYYQNRDRINETNRRYSTSEGGRRVKLLSNHRRKAARLNNHSVFYTLEQVQNLKELFNNQCAYCGKKSSLTLDHFVPSSQGGPNCLGNLIPACLSCNSSKRDRNPQEWYKSQRFYSEKRWLKIVEVVGKSIINGQLPLF
ncbi:HNH endonuclease [Nostoc sp. 'Lobaria pulmonaria (5183) cyanobiont']|uniref:HNH endonuclease n=1 Tax=Nostoc sp. 'Lobaria pulmonaria (5183) cyanobiont' TaxID=1618022 RepID=UPI000CF34021|nr:HNH endonuclease signature motif containing protein [Nostoc sp. 'Lobaria pulmonaria (5183) cyanobiont']AVH74398.1 HNH endonuclease [Nostoc sp. 'Lobaria pulmonaria (5183) cyanobiont']